MCMCSPYRRFSLLTKCNRFRVKDKLSGQHVYLSEKALANVFLDLQHEEAGRSYTSVHHPAVLKGEGKNKVFSL